MHMHVMRIPEIGDDDVRIDISGKCSWPSIMAKKRRASAINVIHDCGLGSRRLIRFLLSAIEVIVG